MSDKPRVPSAFTVVFQVPATDRYKAFESTQNIWRGSNGLGIDVQTPEDAIRAAYQMKRRSHQCRLHDDLHRYGRIETIPGCPTQVIIHPFFDLQVVRVEPTSEAYSGGGMCLFEFPDPTGEFTRKAVSMRIRRESFDVVRPDLATAA
jgi:hypothetical protein